MEIKEFIKEDINFFPVIHKIKHEFFFRKWNERIDDITNPKDSWFAIWVSVHIVEMDVNIKCHEANCCIFWVLNIIQCHFDRLYNLWEETNRMRELTNINNKYVCRH